MLLVLGSAMGEVLQAPQQTPTPTYNPNAAAQARESAGWGFEIRHQVRIDGNHVPLGGEAYKGVPGRVDVHRQRLGLMRAQIAGRKAEPVPGRGSGQRRRRGRVVPLDAAPSGILCPRRVGSDRRSLRTDPMETAGLTGQSRSHLIRITRGESAPAGRLGL